MLVRLTRKRGAETGRGRAAAHFHGSAVERHPGAAEDAADVLDAEQIVQARRPEEDWTVERANVHAVLRHQERGAIVLDADQRPRRHQRHFLAGGPVDHLHITVGIRQLDERVVERRELRHQRAGRRERARVEPDSQRHHRSRRVAENNRAEVGPRPRRVRLAVLLAQSDELVLDLLLLGLGNSGAGGCCCGSWPAAATTATAATNRMRNSWVTQASFETPGARSRRRLMRSEAPISRWRPGGRRAQFGDVQVNTRVLTGACDIRWALCRAVHPAGATCPRDGALSSAAVLVSTAPQVRDAEDTPVGRQFVSRGEPTRA